MLLSKKSSVYFSVLTAALLIFLPFERIPSFNVHGLTVRLSTFVILVFILTGLPILIVRRQLAPLSAIDKAILVFYSVCLLSIGVATDHHRAIVVAALLGFVICAYVLISRVLRDKFDVDLLFRIFLANGALTALFGLYQFIANSFFGVSAAWTLLAPNYVRDILGFARVQSVGIEPLYYGAFLFLPLFIIIARQVTTNVINVKLMVWLSIMFLAFVLTIARGAYLGFIVACVVLVVVGGYTRMLRPKGLKAVGVTLVLVLMVSQLCIRGVAWVNHLEGRSAEAGANSTQVLAQHLNLGAEVGGGTQNPRIETYKDAWHFFAGHPILGIGLGNYGALTSVQKTPENQWPIVNNQYLETLAETGVLGFVCFAILWTCVVLKLVSAIRKTHSPEALWLIAVVAALAVQYNFFSTIYILLIWVIIALIDSLPTRPANQPVQ